MRTLTEPWRESAQQVWTSLVQGWRDLRRRSWGALTRFRHSDTHNHGDLADWGLVATDLCVDDERIVVRMELPGMDREDLQIDIDGKTLSVSGDKRIDRESGEGRYRMVQCVYGRFRRDLILPHEVDAAHIQARYSNGVLHIDMPLKDGHRAHRVPVR